MLNLPQHRKKAAANFSAAAQARAPVPTYSVNAHVFLEDVAAIIDSSNL